MMETRALRRVQAVRYLMGKSHVVAVHKTHERSRNLKRKKWPAARDQRVEASHRIQATDGGQKVGLQSESLNVDLGHAVVQVQRSRVEVPPVPPANHKATIATRVALALTEKNEIEVQKKKRSRSRVRKRSASASRQASCSSVRKGRSRSGGRRRSRSRVKRRSRSVERRRSRSRSRRRRDRSESHARDNRRRNRSASRSRRRDRSEDVKRRRRDSRARSYSRGRGRRSRDRYRDRDRERDRRFRGSDRPSSGPPFSQGVHLLGGGEGGSKGGGKGISGEVRPGDWQCPGCGINVFASKSACFKCGTGRDGNKVGKGEGKGGLPQPDKFSTELWEEPRENISLKLISEIAPPSLQWNYVLKDDSRRSYAAYMSCPFTPEQCTKFFEDTRSGVEWKQPEGPQGPIPRKTAWMVSKGCCCTYRYGSIEVEPQEFPPWMVELMQSVMPLCGFPTQDMWPTSCNLNLYEDGGMSVGWHSDDESLFQGKFRDVRILSLSLGVARRFDLRANWPGDGERPLRPLMLGNGDLCTMEGMTQKHFQHRVPKENNVQGPRINLTWRWVLKHTPRCPAGRMR